MSGRAIRITARVIFGLCGVTTIVTAAPFAILQGVDLPYEREWIFFVVVLGAVGVCSLAAGVLPSSWIAKAGRAERQDPRLFSRPLKLLCLCAGIGYLTALLAYFAPHTWNLNPQLMFVLCPMYFVKLTFDPSTLAVLLLLGPMNAAVFGAIGALVGYVGLAAGHKTWIAGPPAKV